MYEEADYANNRLRETVVRLKDGTPILIHECRSDRVSYSPLKVWDDREDMEIKTCKMKDLDIDPVPLGYCNIQGKALYVTRMPMRQDWKQGLRKNNICLSNGQKFPASIGTLADTIRGNYPSFTEAIMKLKTSVNKNPFNRSLDKPTSIGFARDFSVLDKGEVQYKGILSVGKYNDNGDFDIFDKFYWVEDSLKLAVA